jgi:hypothetical protein
VKQLLDAASRGPLDELVDTATARELEKWFGLPSVTELDEAATAMPDDAELAELAEIRARQERVSADVDPVLLERLYARAEADPATLIRFAATIDVRVDPDIAMFDHAMAERQLVIAEPREVEISEELRDDMKDVTPQALLRDLHRPDLTFDKTFEVVDYGAEQRLDIVAEVELAMATSWKLPPLGPSPFREEYDLLAEDRRIRHRPWSELPMRNRRVTE